jgi:hypothetical protein
MKSMARVLSVLMIVVTLGSLANVLQIRAAEGAKVFVDPMDTVLQSPPMVSGSTFTVNVTIANITGFVGVQFHLTWDPTLLSCEDMQEVLFHTVTPVFDWSNLWNVKLAFNNTGGYADYAQTWKDDVAAVGDGYAPANVTTANFPSDGELALATLTMRVGKIPPFRGSVSCVLGLSDIIAGDVNAHSIPLTTVNGTYTLSWSPPVMTPFFSVDPPTYAASNVGEVFNISVKVNSLDPGWEAVSFEFKLGYDNTLLQVLSVWEGPWLPSYGAAPNQGTSFIQFVNLTYVQLRDAVNPDVNGTLHPPWPQGSGVIAIIQFNATMQGRFSNVLTCPLHLYDTGVEDALGNVVNQTASVDGFYNITAFVPVPQMTVVTDKPLHQIGEQILVQGNLSYNGSPVPQEPVTIEVQNPKNDTVVTTTLVTDAEGVYNFTFVLTDLKELGNYTVCASSNYLGQNATATAIFALRSILGDVNGDGTVNQLDAAALADSFLLTSSSPAWNPNADMNDDNAVNILDAIILANHFLQHYP